MMLLVRGLTWLDFGFTCWSWAGALYEQNLADRMRVLGPDHADTLGSRNNLALTYEAAGDLELAIPLFQQNLDDSIRVLGPGHPDTVLFRRNLAAAPVRGAIARSGDTSAYGEINIG